MTSVPVLGRRRAVPRAWPTGRHGRVQDLHRTAVTLLAAVVLSATVAAAPAPAQGRRTIVVPHPLVVIARSNLTFGNVLPGIRSSVDARDVVHAALFEIQGPSETTVRVEFVLPDAMRNETGGMFPIFFDADDGNASHTLTPGAGFSPNAPLISTLGAEGRIFVRLGGSVQPNRPQAAGAYSAIIYLTVYDIST